MATRSRRRFDDDDYLPTSVTATSPDDLADPATIEEPCWSNYPDAVHGPAPTPEWVITSPGATDTDLGVMKTGKEADVSLIRREFEGRATLLAVKQYRDAKHRMFHRDAGYLEGRRMRRSRENRAMATRTGFGRELIAGQWAAAEFAVLSRLWRAGAAVPYPVQLDGTELAMEFIGKGFSLKSLLRTIVTSRAYRQDSARRELLSERDPYNRLLGRGAAVRLPAEPEPAVGRRRSCKREL